MQQEHQYGALDEQSCALVVRVRCVAPSFVIKVCMASLSPSIGVDAATGRWWNRRRPRIKYVPLLANDATAVSASQEESGTILTNFADQSTAPFMSWFMYMITYPPRGFRRVPHELSWAV